MLHTSLFLALWVATAAPQHTATVRQIDVQIDHCSIRPDTIELIINDRVEKSAKFQTTTGHWLWTSETPIDFGVPKQAQVGVHFPGGRTRCRKYDDFAGGKASFIFPRCIIDTLDVNLKVSFAKRHPSPPDITYLRTLAGDDNLDSPCGEELRFPANEAHDFFGFWNAAETISIYLYKPARDPKGKPLPLDTLLKKKGNGRIVPKSTVNGPDRVVVGWAKQNLKTRGVVAPNELDIDVKTLDDIAFQSITLFLEQR